MPSFGAPLAWGAPHKAQGATAQLGTRLLSCMMYRGSLHISPLAFLVLFIFSPPTHMPGVPLCSFSLMALNSKSPTLATATGRRMRGITHSAREEAETRLFFFFYSGIQKWFTVQISCIFHLSLNLCSSQELLCSRLWLSPWLLLWLKLTQRHLNSKTG